MLPKRAKISTLTICSISFCMTISLNAFGKIQIIISINVLKQYKAVLTPDFSLYTDMATPLQMYNTFQNRWCGAYLVSKGIPVIPTVSWGDKSTFDFCFEGIENGSTAAVSTYIVSEYYHHFDPKEFFMAGYNEMLSRIDPKIIICYNTPFLEIDGNIIVVDYDLSSW